ncbi:MAG: leucine--tRNA ligase, partial [Candidatus Liptonbacteria bacterium RIFOXYB1_FULL_36_10]
MYNHRQIEKKWQNFWKKNKTYQTKENSKAKNFYVLDMFPYPSGEGLHVGHVEGYTASDIFSRFLRMKGFNILHPMGWDAFGLPAENYAIKKKIHPSLVVKKNVANFKKQLDSIGFSYDWSREINTTDPEYYRWTQWIFLKLFENDLAYEAKIPVNWCPSCKTVLANEEAEKGECERCHTKVVRQELKQWMLKITAYADRLLSDLKNLDWPEKVKLMQENWIGKSSGAEVKFEVKNRGLFISVYTTRIDTIFSSTFLILAPEHDLLNELKSDIKNWPEVNRYIKKAKNKPDLERTNLKKEKTGIELKGIKVINPATGAEMPVWISDFVLPNYGTGAVFADAHDERDFIMAKKYKIPLKVSIKPKDEKLWAEVKKLKTCYDGDGILINSGQFDGLTSQEARPKIIFWLKEKKLAKEMTNYKLRDWIFSRQRYWGEPIPIIKCPTCGNQAVPEKDLPIKLPFVKSYEPTGEPESPLAGIKKWVEVKCPKCGGHAKRETNTMPQWAGSCWYYLRFIDPKNKLHLVSEKKEKIWSPVTLYIGGVEHAVLHLLYARFWHKFLFDIKVVSKP